jgi:hypothetical protein
MVASIHPRTIERVDLPMLRCRRCNQMELRGRHTMPASWHNDVNWRASKEIQPRKPAHIWNTPERSRLPVGARSQGVPLSWLNRALERVGPPAERPAA